MPSDDSTTSTDAVEVRRERIDENGVEVDGWVARHGETEAVGHGREEALRRLVVAVAPDADSDSVIYLPPKSNLRGRHQLWFVETGHHRVDNFVNGVLTGILLFGWLPVLVQVVEFV